MAEFKQYENKADEKKLEDFFDIRGNTVYFKGVFRTQNFLTGTSGVEIKNEGLATGSLNVAGATSGGTSTTIPGALTHTGSTAGFFNTAPVSKPTVTFGNTNGEIGGLTISAAYNQGEVTALRDKCEELADDCRNLKAALATLGLIT
jgi:hypothetical protein